MKKKKRHEHNLPNNEKGELDLKRREEVGKTITRDTDPNYTDKDAERVDKPKGLMADIVKEREGAQGSQVGPTGEAGDSGYHGGTPNRAYDGVSYNEGEYRGGYPEESEGKEERER